MANKPLELVRGAPVREMVLRAELTKKADELEKEKAQHREDICKLEAKFENVDVKKNLDATLRTLKECYKDARAEIEYLKRALADSINQNIEYKEKYMKSLQQVEEHKQLLDVQNMDNMRIAEQVNLEILCIRKNYNEKLRELEPYPELLKKTEMSLNKEREQSAKAVHAIEMLTSSLNVARERVHILMHTMVETPEETEEDSLKRKEVELFTQKIDFLKHCINKQKLEIETYKSKVLLLEQRDLENDKRLMRKVQECVELGGEVDKTRIEANEAVHRMSMRFEVTRRKMEIQINDLEHKLKMAETKLLSAEKEKDKIEDSFETKLFLKNEAYEKAYQRILALNAKVQELQRSKTPDDGGDDLDDRCACGTIFVNLDSTKTKKICIN